MDINLLAHIKNKTPKALGKKHTFFFILLLISTFNFQLSTHAQETSFPTEHLQLWLRADSVEITDGKVSRWYDLSPNNYVIQQTAANARPTINEYAINNNPSLVFNGTSTWLNGGNILNLGSNDWTWIIIGKEPSYTWNKPYLSKSNRQDGTYMVHACHAVVYIGTTEYWLNSGVPYSNSWKETIWELDRGSAESRIYINGLFRSRRDISTGNMSNTANFNIGASQNEAFSQCQIAEIIAFNTVNDSLRYSVNEYLVNKYFPDQNTHVSLGLDIHIPYGFCDTAITTAYNPDFISYQWSTGETDSVIHVNRSGRYTVTVTNSFGVTSTDNISVYFPEHFQMQDTTICAGDTIYWNIGLDSDEYTMHQYRQPD